MATLVSMVQQVIMTLVLAPTLVACNLAPKKIEPVIPMPDLKEEVRVDPFLLKPCPKRLAMPQPGTYNEGETLKIISIWDGQLYDCASRHEDLTKLVQKAFNIKELPPPDPPPVIQPASSK